MTSKELRDKRSKLMFDAHQIMSGETVSAEQRQSVAKMLADAQQFGSDADMLEACEAETRSASNVQRSQIGDTAEARSREERYEATSKALRSYLVGERFESRDLTVSANGVLIPTGVADPKIAKKSAGSVYDVVGKLRTSTGEPMQLPLINDTANGFVLNSANISTADPTIGSLTISVDDLRADPIELDRSLIQDSAFDLVSFIQTATQDKYMRSVSSAITSGNGSHVGALTAVSTKVTTAANTAITYADLVQVLATIEPAYMDGACWLMSNTTLANQVYNIKDSNARPIFLPFNDGGQSGFAGTIFGYPVKINPYQTAFAAAAEAVVQFGNFQQGYTLREVEPGVTFRVLNERYGEFNQIGVVAFARVGGALTDAGTHPIVSLKIHA